MSKYLRISVLSFSLILGTAAAAGAQGAAPGGDGGARTTDTREGGVRTTDARTDRGFDWGWLGLAGLLGLGGLMRGNRDAHRNHAAVGTRAGV